MNLPNESEELIHKNVAWDRTQTLFQGRGSESQVKYTPLVHTNLINGYKKYIDAL